MNNAVAPEDNPLSPPYVKGEIIRETELLG